MTPSPTLHAPARLPHGNASQSVPDIEGLKMPRNAKAYEHKHEIGDPMPAGAYYFVYRHGDDRDAPIGIIHGCPCNCGKSTLLFFRGHGIDKKDEWDVSGEWPNVTLKPSIGIGKQENGSYHWHGFLENGEFVER